MAESRKRIEWIDALRGFTMILVVFSHVEISGFGMAPGYAGINDFFRTFRMPLFFFVSGFIAFRMQEWDWGLWRNSVLKKMRVQLIPMLFFGLLYAVFFYAQRKGVTPMASIEGFFNDSAKYGYWFTEVLLGMFLIYYTASFVLKRFGLAVRQVLLSVIAIGLYALAYSSVTQFSHHRVANWLCFYYLCLYFQFFVFGNIIACYQRRVFEVLHNKYVSGAVLLLFAGLYIFYLGRSDVQHDYVVTDLSKLALEAIRYLGVLTTVMLFQRYEASFSKKNWVGRGLQFIGGRTLDVYLLHYFFIPAIPAIGVYLSTTGSMVLESVVVLLFSLLVIGFCLAVSSIIRISPWLAYWLLGVKQSMAGKE
ncbi:MAG: acyltransferase [Bacteroidales bacterium]|nr:acyltransferase [Bacteroidales bacterium]